MSTENINVEGFAERLKSRMRELLINQADLARKIQVSQGTISNWLHGIIPHKRTLHALADALLVREEWLVNGTEPKLSNIFTTGPTAEDARRELMRIRAQMKPGFAKRLRWLRNKLGMTVRAFGTRCGFDASYISRLETATRGNPSEDFVNALVRAFRVNRNWIHTGEGIPFVDQATSGSGINDEWALEELSDLIEKFARKMRTTELNLFIGMLLERRIDLGEPMQGDLLRRLNKVMADRLVPENLTSLQDYEQNGLTFAQLGALLSKLGMRFAEEQISEQRIEQGPNPKESQK